MEEDKVQEAEVENVSEKKEEDDKAVGENPKKSKRDFYIEMALILILGILLGVAIKSEALKKITIGFNDYQMKIVKSDYDINKLEKDLAEKEKAAAVSNTQSSETQPTGEEAPGGGSCGS